MTAQKQLRLALVVVVVLATVAGVAVAWQSVSGAPTRDFPTVRVQRGNIEQKVYTAGELVNAK